jgi:hypothetical protein
VKEMSYKLRNTLAYIESFLKIRTKENKIVPFKLNQPQRKLYKVIKAQAAAKRAIRVIILKARQMGFSTLTEGLIFKRTATKFNVDSMIIAHKDEATANLFKMNRLFYSYLPQPLQPQRKASNAQELVFDVPTRGGSGLGLNSRIKCTTAGGDGVGRSDTLTNVHMSEFAFWPGDKMETFSGIMQAVPDNPETMVVIESTANGFDEFKDLWDAAVAAWDAGERDGFQPVFFAWWEMAEYRRPVPPDFKRTEEEQQLAETYGLDDEQLAWRRWCIKNNCAGDKNKFRQEYPASPDEAFIASGACVFDQEAIVLRREQVKDTAWERGAFRFDYDDRKPKGKKISKIRWEPDPKGIIRVHAPPQDGYPYVIGGDTAGTGSDKFTGQVLNNITGEQVAVLQHQFDETMYARQMYCLGWWFGWALIGIETNYSTYPEMELERLGYPKLFMRRKEDTFTGGFVNAFGFETTSTTRPIIIDGLKDMTREHLETIGDFETLGEMLAFVYNEKYRPEAEVGKHDDLVMALAIAHYIRSAQRRTVKLPKGKRVKWTPDQWEDYRAADSETKAYLLEKWGSPF